MELENYRKAESIVVSIDRIEDFLGVLTGTNNVELTADGVLVERRSRILLIRHARLKEKLIEAVREELDTLKKEFEEL